MNEAFAAQVLGNMAAFESNSFAKNELRDTQALGSIRWINSMSMVGQLLRASPRALAFEFDLLYELHRRGVVDGRYALAVRRVFFVGANINGPFFLNVS